MYKLSFLFGRKRQAGGVLRWAKTGWHRPPAPPPDCQPARKPLLMQVAYIRVYHRTNDCNVMCVRDQLFQSYGLGGVGGRGSQEGGARSGPHPSWVAFGGTEAFVADTSGGGHAHGVCFALLYFALLCCTTCSRRCWICCHANAHAEATTHNGKSASALHTLNDRTDGCGGPPGRESVTRCNHGIHMGQQETMKVKVKLKVLGIVVNH